MKTDMKSYKKDSTIFLLPLLGIQKETIFKENYVTTYITDYRFPSLTNYVCIAYQGENPDLNSLNNLYGKVFNNNGQVFYFFILDVKFELDYARFLTGRYSKFSKTAKEKIIEFWNANKLSLIFGILYKTAYAKLLYLNNLKYHTGGIISKTDFEYWPKPNLSKETYVLK